MKDVNEKEQTMNALPKLKRTNLKIHVTDDLTNEDRRNIATLRSEAKMKNAEETEAYVWRVTGSPTKFRLSRILKKNAHTTKKQKEQYREAQLCLHSCIA